MVLHAWSTMTISMVLLGQRWTNTQANTWPMRIKIKISMLVPAYRINFGLNSGCSWPARRCWMFILFVVLLITNWWCTYQGNDNEGIMQILSYLTSLCWLSASLNIFIFFEKRKGDPDLCLNFEFSVPCNFCSLFLCFMITRQMQKSF